jgi:hypothetical protein
LIAPFAGELDRVFLAETLELLELLSPREQWLHERHVSTCQPTICASGNGNLNMPQRIQLGTVSPHSGLITSTSGHVPASGTAREPTEILFVAFYTSHPTIMVMPRHTSLIPS